jgi:hypothetical protein
MTPEHLRAHINAEDGLYCRRFSQAGKRCRQQPAVQIALMADFQRSLPDLPYRQRCVS